MITKSGDKSSIRGAACQHASIASIQPLVKALQGGNMNGSDGPPC